MARRKIRDEADAPECFSALEASGLLLPEWARENGAAPRPDDRHPSLASPHTRPPSHHEIVSGASLGGVDSQPRAGLGRPGCGGRRLYADLWTGTVAGVGRQWL